MTTKKWRWFLNQNGLFSSLDYFLNCYFYFANLLGKFCCYCALCLRSLFIVDALFLSFKLVKNERLAFDSIILLTY